jgi:multiple sugar transport system ATP-binding protein
MDSGLILPLPPGRAPGEGRKVVYGVRPEHMAPGDGIKATVNVTEPTGPDLHIYADLGGEEICAITPERLSLARGDSISFSPRLDRIHLFDAETGKAII